jgi:hypothetical protein
MNNNLKHKWQNFITSFQTWFLKKWGKNSIYLGILKANSILLQSNNHQSNSKVLSALDQQYPNWKDSFINSPLEENIIPHIINVLSNNLQLHFIILYLLIMLLIIITCKYILKDNIEFTKIQNNPLGA